MAELRLLRLPSYYYEGKPPASRRRGYAIFGDDVVLDGRAYETTAYANAVKRTRHLQGEVRLVRVAHA